MKIFYSAPLFTLAEISFNESVAHRLKERGYSIFLPQQECLGLQGETIFETCRKGILESDVVLACVDGTDADSGTCWECGFAVGQNKPLVIFRTDFRQTGDTGGFNAMLCFSANAVVEEQDFNALIDKIHQVLTQIDGAC